MQRQPYRHRLTETGSRSLRLDTGDVDGDDQREDEDTTKNEQGDVDAREHKARRPMQNQDIDR